MWQHAHLQVVCRLHLLWMRLDHCSDRKPSQLGRKGGFNRQTDLGPFFERQATQYCKTVISLIGILSPSPFPEPPHPRLVAPKQPREFGRACMAQFADGVNPDLSLLQPGDDEFLQELLGERDTVSRWSHHAGACLWTAPPPFRPQLP